MKLTLIHPKDKNKTYSAFVLFIHKDTEEKKLSAYPGIIKKAFKEKLFKGCKNEFLFLPYTPVQNGKHLLLAGLGEKKDFSPQTLFQSASLIYKTLAQKKLTGMQVDCSLAGGGSLDFNSKLKALAHGFLLADYKFDDYIQKKEKKTSSEILFLTPGSAPVNKSWTAVLNEAEIICSGVNFARRLGDTPGNLMTPALLAEQAQKKAKGLPLRVTVWNKEKIKKEKMGGLIGVSKGSREEPRFIIMEYKGAKEAKKPVCFVGKGVTFDSGGISIKPSARMDEMKYDMCGASAVISAMHTIAKLKLKLNAMAFVPAAENMPGASASKPGDILTARNGKTMEVLNTDAEGRLILADALSYAVEKKPQVIFDAATLTGAMVVALGNSHTGFYTRSEKLRQRILDAAVKSGENVWPMPLTDDHTADIKSETADVANIATSPQGAGSATAAAFLEHFVKRNIPWAHFDIAGTAWNASKRLNYCSPKGASGVMVRTFVELAKSYI